MKVFSTQRSFKVQYNDLCPFMPISRQFCGDVQVQKITNYEALEGFKGYKDIDPKSKGIREIFVNI